MAHFTLGIASRGIISIRVPLRQDRGHTPEFTQTSGVELQKFLKEGVIGSVFELVSVSESKEIHILLYIVFYFEQFFILFFLG